MAARRRWMTCRAPEHYVAGEALVCHCGCVDVRVCLCVVLTCFSLVDVHASLATLSRECVIIFLDVHTRSPVDDNNSLLMTTYANVQTATLCVILSMCYIVPSPLRAAAPSSPLVPLGAYCLHIYICRHVQNLRPHFSYEGQGESLVPPSHTRQHLSVNNLTQ